jgi:diguanylate cyclase (GGDEF)-like protein
LLAILDSAGEGIVVLDANGEVLYFNPTAASILRVDLDHLDAAVWRGARGLYLPDRETQLPAEANPLLRALNGESTSNVEIFVRHSRLQDGVFIRATGRPIIDHQGQFRGAVVTFRDATQLRANREAAQQLAIHDPLTSLANRRALNERLEQFLAQAKHGREFALALMDLDRFKQINDEHGHQAGDEVLVAAATRMQETLRATDFVARFGGDEFCVIMADVDESQGIALGRRLQYAVQSAHPLRISTSVGIAAFDEGRIDSAEKLIRSADEALYRAKAKGRGRVVGYSQVDSPVGVEA